jgi:hypothetical protein
MHFVKSDRRLLPLAHLRALDAAALLLLVPALTAATVVASQVVLPDILPRPQHSHFLLPCSWKRPHYFAIFF